MGGDRPFDPARKARRQQTHSKRTRGGERADLHPQHRMPLGSAAQGPAAPEHRQRLLPPLGV